MFKLKFFLFLLFVSTSVIFAHKEWVHQYLVRQAYSYLKYHNNMCIPAIEQRMGNDGSGAESPWVNGTILAGAWREDSEDVMGNSGSYSGAHFWKADISDTQMNTIPIYGAQMNSYQKAIKFSTGNNWLLKTNPILYNFPTHPNGSGSCATQRATCKFQYDDLFDLLINRNIYVTEVVWNDGSSTTFNTRVKFNSSYWSSLNGTTYNQWLDGLVYEILGRMCHLLGDMSVPAHVHFDMHACDLGDADFFEIFFGGSNPDYCNQQNTAPPLYQLYTSQTAKNSGAFINPFLGDPNDPIRYLFYCTNQITDHFPSTDIGGNNNVYNNPYPGLQTYITGLGSPPPRSTVDDAGDLNGFLAVADVSVNYVINSIASLLYWFAIEGNLEIKTPSITITPTINNVGTVYGGYAQIISSFTIFNNGALPLSLKIKTTNPISDLDLSISGKQSERTISLAVWQSTTINYQAIAPLYAGAFTGIITIDALDYNIHKTHTIIGTVPIPDFCFAETDKMAASPEEELFDKAFKDKFLQLDSLSKQEKNELSTKEKMNFAYEMFELADTEPVSMACIKSIDTYPSTEMDMAFYALGILWESSLDEKSSKEFNIDDFKKYLNELIQRKEKHRVYGYAEFILSFLEEDNRLERLKNVYNNYSDNQLAELSLFQQFIYHFIQINDRKSALNITEQMDKEFPNSTYAYQTHILLEDKGYTLEGLEELMKKNEKIYLTKKTLGKYSSSIAKEEEIVPTEYQLNQNYPNPFNPTTAINYSLPENTFVNLYVYNSMGQLVKTLVSDYKSAGSYNVIWDSTNDFGNNVSSGTYFYILITKNKVFSNKMLLLK